MPIIETPRGQVPRHQRKARHRSSRAERFERNVARMPEEPLLPVVMNAFERILAEEASLTDVERIIAEGLARHPELDRATIARWIEAWHEIPATVRRRITPPELSDLARDRGADLATVQRVVQRSARGKPSRMAPAFWAQFPALTVYMSALLGPPAVVAGTVERGLDGVNLARFGQVFRLTGQGFSAENSENTIVITPQGHDEPAFVSHPTASTQDELRCLAPPSGSTPPGPYALQVLRSGHKPSNAITLYLEEPIAQAGSISSAAPPRQYPTKTINLAVTGIGSNPLAWWVPVASGGLPYPSTAVTLDPGLIEVTVPPELLRAPGDYLVSVHGDNQKLSNQVRVQVAAYSYRVTFLDIVCVDESDPEGAGNDEIVTRWGLEADGTILSKGTGQYCGFSDGVVRSYQGDDRLVFPGDGPGEVREHFALSTQLWEWDAGDAEDWNTALQVVAEIVEEIPVVGQVLGVLVSLTGWLIQLCGGDPDWLGTHTDEWLAEDLFHETGTSGRLDRTAHFYNDDDTGSYEVTYAIERSPV